LLNNLPELPSLEPMPTAAERAATLIREYIFEGKFQPGMPLPEASLAASLHVSRNTVREAYRTLMSEHLLTYSPHKGVTVRSLTAEDVRDIYDLRRLLELRAVDRLSAGADFELTPLAVANAEGQMAKVSGKWQEVGTANLRFHAALVATLGSVRTDEFFARLMTELRLGFLAVANPAWFHGEFLDRNVALLDLLSRHEYDKARTALTRYLTDAETPVLTAVTG
jgi:DNA-binding GntR family transcriptional regulator